MTYPSGSTVTFSLSDAGRVSGVSGVQAGASKTYAAEAKYGASGLPLGAKYSGSTLEEKRTYNALGQMTAMEVTQGGATTLAITNGYAPNSSNGNLLWQRTAVTPQLTYEQHYGYDAANRLRIVTEGADNGSLDTSRCADIQPTWPAGTWCTRYGYDGFGNLWTEEAVNALGVKPFGSAWYLQGSSTVTNRMKNVGYDAAGNLVEVNVGDKLTFGDYDGENQLRRIRAKASAGAPDTQDTVVSEYFYDGNGRRVKRKWGSVETFYVYGAEDELIAEYGSGSSGSTGGGSEFLFADHLGSTRLKIGSETKRWDYEPFGRVISRTGNGYGVDDALTQRFTGKERDVETGMDWFFARHYSSTQGRFTSPDPSALYFADPTNPQSLNLYSYVRNNPLHNVDRDGLRCVWDDGSFDSEDDKQTGSKESCEEQGGSWYDPGTYAPGVDWASTNADGTLALHGATPAQSVTVAGTATGVATDAVVWVTGYLADIGIGLANVTKSLAGGNNIPLFRFFGTHHCGPGGAGGTTGIMDRACQAHDECYAMAGLDASANTNRSISLTAQQASAAQACNQALYNAARSNPNSLGSNALRLWLTKGDQTPFGAYMLAPGTEAKQW